MSNIWQWLIELWKTAHENDIPNWFAMSIGIIVVPAIVILWQKRQVSFVPGLEVSFFKGALTFGGKDHEAVTVQFTNHTGVLAYISGVRVRSVTKEFTVPVEASRDIGGNLYHLKFLGSDGHLTAREITLQTGASLGTGMPVTMMPSGFLSHKPTWLRRTFRWQKYFILDYHVMVGTTHYRVMQVW
jgi:hypothetical protein